MIRIPRWLKLLTRGVYVLSICFFQIYVCLFFSGLLYWHGARIVCFTAANLGAYEFGERIYSRTLSRGDTSLVVAMNRPIVSPKCELVHDGKRIYVRSIPDRKNFVEREKELTEVVARVYGRESPQLGLRFAELGKTYDFDLNEYQLAEVYESKAAQIYLKNKRWERVLVHMDSAICLMFCQNNSHPGLRDRLKEFLSIKDLQETELWVPVAYNLESLARQSGNGDLAKEFAKLYPESYKNEREQIDSQFKSKTIPEMFASESMTLSNQERLVKPIDYVISWILVFLVIYCFDYICLGILAFFNKVVIVLKRCQLLRKLNNYIDSENHFDCLDRLICLELYDGKWATADILSRHLIRLAENQQHSINKQI